MAAGIINYSIDKLVFIHESSIKVAGLIGVVKWGYWRVQERLSLQPPGKVKSHTNSPLAAISATKAGASRSPCRPPLEPYCE